MSEIQLEIYNYLLKINKLNSDNYSMLINKYGEKTVNFVIDMMIDCGNDFNKFDYYVERILSYDDEYLNDNLFNVYVNDMNKIKRLSALDNNILAKEIYEIICKIDKIIGVIDLVWVTDRINEYIKKSDDVNKIKEISLLYNEFLNKRNKLVEANLRFVVCISKLFYRNNKDVNDLIQYGNIGLMRAIEKYNPEYNTNFSTYAYYWIKQNISSNISDLEMPFKVSYYWFSLNLLMKRMIREYFLENGCEPTNDEIANKLNISLKKVKKLKMMFSDPISIYSSVANSYENDGNVKMVDVIEDKDCSVEDKILRNYFCEEMNQILYDSLTEQEYYIISHRFGIGGADFMTLNELGNKLGLSGERVRQVEKRIEKKLKKKCNDLYVYLI